MQATPDGPHTAHRRAQRREHDERGEAGPMATSYVAATDGEAEAGAAAGADGAVGGGHGGG